MLTASALESIAEDLQAKLAAFRLTNYVQLRSVANSQSRSASLSPNVESMARALALPITGDAELECQLLTIVQDLNEQTRIAHDGEPEWFAAIALLDLAHLRGPGAPDLWTCKDLANRVQCIAGETGESFSPKPRKVGGILRSLGLRTQKLGSYGRGLSSSETLKDRIHKIAKELGICAGDLLLPESSDAPVTCVHCEHHGLNFDNRGKKLRYKPFSLEA